MNGDPAGNVTGLPIWVIFQFMLNSSGHQSDGIWAVRGTAPFTKRLGEPDIHVAIPGGVWKVQPTANDMMPTIEGTTIGRV
jgi:hypothetical protein